MAAFDIRRNTAYHHEYTHYTVFYNSTAMDTTVTTRPDDVINWINFFRNWYVGTYRQNRLIVGMSLRWTPFLVPLIGHRHETTASIHFFLPNSCLIFHLCHATHAPQELINFLIDPRIRFVGMESRQYAARLLNSRHQMAMLPGMPLDVRDYVHDRYRNPLNHAPITHVAAEVLGAPFPPDLAHPYDTDWQVMALTHMQVANACIETYLCFTIAMLVQQTLPNPNLFLLDYSDSDLQNSSSHEEAP